VENEVWEFDWKYLKGGILMAYISNCRGYFGIKLPKMDILMDYISRSHDSERRSMGSRLCKQVM
jgi:hypothetical protein